MLSFCVTILACFGAVKSAKILVVIPTPSMSHHVVFRPLVEELIERNHEVTLITNYPIYPQSESPYNLKEIDLHNLSRTIWPKVTEIFAKTGHSNLIKMTDAYCWFAKMFSEQLKHDAVQKLIKDKMITFDLLLIESCIPGALIFSHIFKAPVIFIGSSGALPGNMRMIGSETHPLLYPNHYHEKIYNLTLWERICELYIGVGYNKVHEDREFEYDTTLKSLFGADTPTLNDLKNNVNMLFLNIHPLWIHNQPTAPNVVYIWGVHQTAEKMLPKEIQSYLDSSKHGVIYLSFGSNFNSSNVLPGKLETMIKVFSRLPYDILWKWEEDELPGKTDNIKISKWLPQFDILKHPNLKLFITHGGLQSTYEAINAGVPLIGIPLFADQGYNTEKYVYFKIGMKLDYKSLTTDKFEHGIKNIFKNYNSYKENIIRLRTMMGDQPKPALEHAIWWIDYTLRHGGVQHRRAPAANISWTEYYEVEIVLLILIGLLFFGVVLLVTVYTCIRSILRFVTFD